MNNTQVTIILIISLVGCGVALEWKSNVEMRPGEASFEQLYNKGIGQPWIGGNPPWAKGKDKADSSTHIVTSNAAVSPYSEYYQLTEGSAPSAHITVPERFNMAANPPATMYFKDQKQAFASSHYQTYAAYTGGSSLWIKGTKSWAQYVQVPQGARLSLISITPVGGSGYLYEIYPDGKLVKNSFSFYPYNQMSFRADTIGQHILLLAIGNLVSNAVVIDVVGYEKIFQPPYLPPYQPPGHPPLAY